MTKKNTDIQVGKVTLTFSITMDEAKALIGKPNTTTAKNLRKYILNCLKAAARKMLETKHEKDVKECNIPIE